MVVEAGALYLFSYMFWFHPVSFVALTLEHVKLLPNNILEVTDIARKATGVSAAKHAACRTKIVKRHFVFAPGSRIRLCLLLFLELSVARATPARSSLFRFCVELDVNMAIQCLLSAALYLQLDLGTPAE